MSDYYESPLNWENLKLGTAFVEMYLGDVIFIKKKKETDDDDFYICDYYDAYDTDVKKNRKFSYEAWLMVGFADWEYKVIDPKHFNRSVIKSYLRQKMDDEEDIF